jgi:peptidoglycan/xylan/chitin deacetylase (PgdA/CDA1 family)
LFRFAGNLISPAGVRARLIILIYHRVLPAPDPILHDEIDAASFERQLGLLAEEFNVLPLGEACRRLTQGTLPARAACITFDDGYADNEQIALPILKRFNLRATFFVSTGFSSGSAMFNDGVINAVRTAAAGDYDLSELDLPDLSISDLSSRSAAIEKLLAALKYRHMLERQSSVEQLSSALRVTPPHGLMMTPAQIARLHREGMEIGAHTVNHPILMSISEDEARSEIVESKRVLEEITGSAVTLFAYPNGKPGQDYGPQHVRLVRDAGFSAAVSTTPGVAHSGTDVFQLPRFGPWERDPRKLGIRLLLSCARARPNATLVSPSASNGCSGRVY